MKLTLSTFLFVFMLALFGFGVTQAGTRQQQTQLEQTIAYLMDYVAASQLTFIRNATEYTGREAAEHMNKKYQHFKDKITTPEDFIERAASRSLLSGKPYLVVTGDGTTLQTGDWLRTVLSDYREEKPGNASQRRVANGEAPDQSGKD